MSQKLILPIDSCAFSAGYKNAAYLRQQGYIHYGVDLYSLTNSFAVRACGNGTVLYTGKDGNATDEKLGNCVVIVYKDVEFNDGRVSDLACRMFHFDSIAVKTGDVVSVDTIIGNYGNTGSSLVLGKKMGKHLHIEFDTDIKYPQYAVGIKSSGNVIKKGTVDSTVNPSSIWFLGDDQYIQGIYTGWYDEADINIPKLNNESTEIPIAFNEDTYDCYYGVPVWLYTDRIDKDRVVRLFDKWWRKVPSDTSLDSGRYATESEMNSCTALTSALIAKYNIEWPDPTDPKGKAGVSSSSKSDTSGNNYEEKYNELINNLKKLIENA